MFYIYANGRSIFQPMDNSLSLFAPKLTLEMGKAGSLTFQIPPTNRYYNSLPQLTTTITVEMDDVEIFRGRVLTNNRSFNNVRTIYCEGNLAFLVDSVQKAEKFDGKAHDLFRKIIAAHNARVEDDKQFTVGDITIENRDVLLSGKSDDITDQETGHFDYKQIAINSIAEEWQNTFDFIETCLIDYTGGYLRTRREGNKTYIDLLSEYGATSTQDIEFGKNLLDLNEEVSAEDVFTVLIPLGDENLTIESVNGGSDELVDEAAVRQYGRIVKTHVFDSVNQAETLLENGRRFLESNVNVPVTVTVKAVDMHLIDPNAAPIYIGDKVHVLSVPHGMTDTLTCTKIEYDMENPANNTYTFGVPKQSLTERYRKDKAKDSQGGGGGGGAGGAADAADEEANKKLDEFFDAWINVDKEAAHIDLGTLYKKYNDEKEILESSCGISLDAPSGNINIKTLRKEFDEMGATVKEQAAYIDMLNNELGARIDLVASQHQTLADQESSHFATLSIQANDHESRIAANTEAIKTLDGVTTESKTNITQLSNDLQAQITLEALHNTTLEGKIQSNSTAITQVATDLDAQVKLEAQHKSEIDGKITSANTSISQVASDLASQITLEATHKTELEGKISTNSTNISTVANDLSAQVTLEASHKKELDGKITSANTKITTLTNNLNAQITLEASHKTDLDTKIAAIQVKADANASSITLKADKTTLNSKVTTINGRLDSVEANITTLQADVANIDTLISNKLKSITIDSLITESTIYRGTLANITTIRAGSVLTVGGKNVATQEYVDGKVSGFATQSWVEGKGYLTALPSSITASTIKATDTMSVGIYTVATQYWCQTTKKFATQDWVNEQLENYAKSDHTHTGYASSSHSHAWSAITGKPTSFTPSSHNHSFSGKVNLKWGHMHTTASTFKAGNNTGGVYNYSGLGPTASFSGTTGNN